ncbi:MAG: hypothetical protein IT539_03955 [Bradyrhizobiaceae bacterium]|nr:hypothetical protein [Bradyrhizobiaceae bacterium]
MRLCRATLVLILLTLAGGCAAPVGDFGRPRVSVFNDKILPKVGGVAAWLREEPVSFGPLTDDERKLRDLAYAILMPPDNNQLWERTIAEWRRTRILPEDMTRPNPADYSTELLETPYRSSTARYARLIEDIRVDSTRPGPFYVVAARVLEMDDVRAKALANMPHLSPEEREQAAARIAENQMIVDWVQQRFAERHAGYQLALERLVVATPAPAAVEAERMLATFRVRLTEFQPPARVAMLGAPPPPGAIVSK